MIEVLMFSSFVFFFVYLLVSRVFKYLKLFDYVISAVFSLLFGFFFYGSFLSSFLYLFSAIGPVLLLKIILDDLFLISYKVKYYRNMVYHIMGFFLFSLVFYCATILSANDSLFFAAFIINIFVCIFYCFYFVFGYRKLDDKDNNGDEKIKIHKRVEYAKYSKNQKDNLSTLPLLADVVEKAEKEAYDEDSDTKMKALEKEINAKRENVLRKLSAKR